MRFVRERAEEGTPSTLPFFHSLFSEEKVDDLR
jgi:hypothetical protein